MKNKFTKGIVLAALALTLTACQAEKPASNAPEENTKVEIQDEKNVNVAGDFEKLVADGASIDEVKKFIDENISSADKNTGDDMVNKLMELQEEDLKEEVFTFSGQEYLDTQKEINKAYQKASSDLGKGYIFAAENKETLLKNIENEKAANDVKKLFDKGYALFSAEGMYYPQIDFMEMKENYSNYVSDMTANYFDIMANELVEPSFIEEYLAVDVNKLKDRTFKYEEFLKDYSDSKYIENVKMYYVQCIWKLVNPNMFDNTIDENFKVIAELNEVYESILSDDAHPVTVEAVKGITEFIKSKNGVLGSKDNMDELYEASHKIHDNATKKIEELYLSK